MQTNCFDVEVAECSTEVEGFVVSVTSRFEIELRDRAQCKSDCVFVEATCRVESIDAEGVYEIRFGDTTTELELPSTGSVLCMGTEEP